MGDVTGEFTFKVPRGSSVTDYGCASLTDIERIRSFSVGTEFFSDHVPIQLKINVGIKWTEDVISPPLPKLKWNYADEEQVNDKVQSNYGLSL